MTSFREERLQEQVAEIRPQLAKAREIAEKAESENRAMTAEGAEDLRRDHGQGPQRRRRGEAASARSGGLRVHAGTLRQRHRRPGRR